MLEAKAYSEISKGFMLSLDRDFVAFGDPDTTVAIHDGLDWNYRAKGMTAIADAVFQIDRGWYFLCAVVFAAREHFGAADPAWFEFLESHDLGPCDSESILQLVDDRCEGADIETADLLLKVFGE